MYLKCYSNPNLFQPGTDFCSSHFLGAPFKLEIYSVETNDILWLWPGTARSVLIKHRDREYKHHQNQKVEERNSIIAHKIQLLSLSAQQLCALSR